MATADFNTNDAAHLDNFLDKAHPLPFSGQPKDGEVIAILFYCFKTSPDPSEECIFISLIDGETINTKNVQEAIKAIDSGRPYQDETGVYVQTYALFTVDPQFIPRQE